MHFKKNHSKNNIINILFIINTWSNRGAQLQLQKFINSLPENINPHIFVLNSKEYESAIAEKNTQLRINFCSKSNQYQVVRFLRLYRYFYLSKPHVVVTLGLGSALFLGRLCAIMHGVRIIYSTLHTVQNLHNFGPHYFDTMNGLLNTILPKCFGGRKIKFLPNSKILANLVEKEAKNYPTNTLYNGFPVKEFDEPYLKKNFRHTDQSYALPDNDFIVLVGALEPEKNHQFALECFKIVKNQFPDLKLVLVGGGSKRKQLSEWVDTHGLANDVFFLGNLKREHVLRVVAKAKVALLTSNTESFPNVVAEAQILGVPVVASDVGGVREIIQDGVTGYVVQPDDKRLFVERLTELVKKKDMALNMGQEGRKRIINQFSMEKKVERFMNFLEQDLNNVA